MSDSKKSSPELSPRKTQTVMMIFAFAIAILIGVAIFSLSRLRSPSWTGSLKDPVITATLRQNLPPVQHDDLNRLLDDLSAEGKWTLLTFWSVTCPPCLEELPLMNALSQSWQGPGFQIVTVNVDSDNAENLEMAKQWLLNEDITLPTIYDKNEIIKKAYEIDAYPRHFLISPAKQIVWQELGAFNWNDNKARDQLTTLMEAQAPELTEDLAE